MKVLIWIICSIIPSFVIALITVVSKNKLGALPTMLIYVPFVFIARGLCKNYDDKRAAKNAAKCQENVSQAKQQECDNKVLDQFDSSSDVKDSNNSIDDIGNVVIILPDDTENVEPTIESNNHTDIDSIEGETKAENEPKPRYCHRCGSKLLTDSKFCSYCGQKTHE